MSNEEKLRAALWRIVNMSQETCITHEDFAFKAVSIAQSALANSMPPIIPITTSKPKGNQQ